MATARETMQFRLRDEEKDTIRRCASLAGVNVSEFVRNAALKEAHHVEADLRYFSLDNAKYAAFLEALGAPVAPNAALNELLHAEAPWD